MESSQKVVDEFCNIPRDIIFRILKDFPVKNLLTLRCVSKLWCSIIDDPLFVQIHHIQSHTRPEAINLLLRYEKQNSCLYSLHPEGGLASYILTLLDKEISTPFQSINGLVCIENSIYNPSTREFKTLPRLRVNVPCDVTTTKVTTPVDVSTKFFLGLDPSTSKYKVLALCRLFSNASEHAQVQFKILTLGTNLWREIDTSELRLDIPQLYMAYAKGYCIADVIYITSKGDSKDVIIAFEVGSEKFRIIRLPDGANTETCFVIQVNEHLALIDGRISAIWILEDYEKQLWSRQSLVVPRYCPSCDVVHCFIPVGTIHTGEILFRCATSELFYYNLETKALRRAWVRSYFGYDTLSNLCITKHVESLYRLKEM
ncbi:putative F-box protein At1g50870 [Cornus florida]|uniref:putative F-box protein At1g50870 n=1 Tax=Cornus florida TaxID=4283 RepID=UPI002898C148|nr:putative F-box protein At1g50870 [Cornus florida]